mgnify:CR=1 FL=1
MASKKISFRLKKIHVLERCHTINNHIFKSGLYCTYFYVEFWSTPVSSLSVALPDEIDPPCSWSGQ